MRSSVRGCGRLVLGLLLVLAAASLLAPTHAVKISGSWMSSVVTVVPFPAPSSSVLGSSSLSAAFMNRLLGWQHSPAAGLGSTLVQLSTQYHIDAAYPLAIFWHESNFGRTGEARVTFSPGNERCIADRPCIDQARGGYAQMRNWADGFAHLFSLLWDGYVLGHVTKPIVGHACTTIDEIIPVFAPSSDGNDVAAYIADVKADVATWRAGRVWV